MIHPSPVALHAMSHSFTELYKAVTCVIILVSFLWLWFYSGGCRIVVLASSVCPLMDEDKRLVQVSWWERLAVGKTESCSGCSVGHTGLEKYFLFVCLFFKLQSQKRQCQRMFKLHTVALISHTNKTKFKILQARLQKSLNWELLDVQTGFRKSRRTRDLIANIHWMT